MQIVSCFFFWEERDVSERVFQKALQQHKVLLGLNRESDLRDSPLALPSTPGASKGLPVGREGLQGDVDVGIRQQQRLSLWRQRQLQQSRPACSRCARYC